MTTSMLRSLLGEVVGAAFMSLFYLTVGACPLGYVDPGWVWTGVQWCTLGV